MYTGPKILSDGLIMAVDFASGRGALNGGVCKEIVTGIDLTAYLMTEDADKNMVYNGTSSYVLLDSTIISTLEGTTEATVEFWLKNNSNINGAGTAGIAQLSGFDSTNGCLYLYNSQSVYLDFFRTNRATVSTNTQAWYDPTEWTHLSVSTKPGTSGWRCMINGVHRYATTGQDVVSIVNGTYVPWLGRNSGGRDFSGIMGNVLLYNRALSDEEKINNYNAQLSRFR